MMSLMAWLFGSGTVPTGMLVWASGGTAIAIALGVLLAVTVGLLATQHEEFRVPAKAPRAKRARPAAVPSAA